MPGSTVIPMSDSNWWTGVRVETRIALHEGVKDAKALQSVIEDE